MTHSTLGRKPIGWTVPLKRLTKLPHQKEDHNLSDFPWSDFGPFRWIFSMFSGPHLSCCLSLYQTQLFSLQPKQIESLITFPSAGSRHNTWSIPLPPYLSFTTVEYTSHTQDKPSWVNLHALPPTHTGDSPICPPSHWLPSDKSAMTVFWWWRWFSWHLERLCSRAIKLPGE